MRPLFLLAPLFFKSPRIFKLPKLSSCTESEEECFIDIVDYYEQEHRTFLDYDNVTWAFYDRQMKYYDPQEKTWVAPIIKKKFKPQLL